jgi:hypothetical protein
MAKTKAPRRQAPESTKTKSAKGKGAKAPKGPDIQPAQAAEEQVRPVAAAPEAPVEATPKTKKAAQEAGPKKVSALDAAARVLAEAGEAMTTKALIEVMAAKGYWTSPGGQTPAATLYSAILREIATKADQGRFVKTERGKFALRGAGQGD